MPTVADRVAQTVVAGHLSERVEQIFHPDSFGYRPGKSALDAVASCRERCWRFDWVVEFDIRKFFDTVPWDKVVAAVEAHTDAGWVVLYVKRWLAAGLRLPDGSTTERGEGTPQGPAVSPVLANLFFQDGRGRSGAASGQDPDRVLQGRQPSGPVSGHRVHVPGVHVQAARSQGQARRNVHRVPARDQ
ncbi:reverse transcriptase domain-containing protein [Streptomyces sp. NPDC001984]